MNRKQEMHALKCLKRYYGVRADRADVHLEVENLRRRFRDGMLYDIQAAIVAAMQCGPHPIKFERRR